MKMARLALLTTFALTYALPGMAQTGNGAPRGAHYNLNIIGVDKGKSASLAGSNRHTIFVWLGKNGGVSSKIYLTPGEEFRVCDGNATDTIAYDCDGVPLNKLSGAVFQLPCNTNLEPGTGPNGEPVTLLPCEVDDPQLAYAVYARPLGTPGGSATITTCAKDAGTGEVVCSTENHLMVRNPSKPTFTNVTQQLTSLVACFDTNPDPTIDDVECFRYALFRSEFEDWFWDYNNNGLKLAQLRFYPLE